MSLIAPHTIIWSRNTVHGMQRDCDKADSFEEACQIAEARVRGAGIPATATISDKSGLLRQYTKDFDNRISYVDGAPQ